MATFLGVAGHGGGEDITFNLPEKQFLIRMSTTGRQSFGLYTLLTCWLGGSGGGGVGGRVWLPSSRREKILLKR